MARVRPTEEVRLALCEWLSANDINPNTVPLRSSLSIRTAGDGSKTIHYTEYVRDDGGILADPETGGPLARNASAPCKVDPHPDLPVVDETR